MGLLIVLLTLLTINVMGEEPKTPCASCQESQESELFYEKINEEGIQLFCSLSYEEALAKFNTTIQDYSKGRVSEAAMGTALWGKILCDAELDHMADFLDDIEDVRFFFLEYHKCPSAGFNIEDQALHIPASFTSQDASDIQSVLERSIPHSSSDILLAANCGKWFDRPIGQIAPQVPVQFANPNEKIKIQDCIDRVVGSAKLLRIGVACLKRREVVWLLNNLISDIESACIRCCQAGGLWTKCVSPIIAKLNQWRAFGIPDDPAWD